MRTRLDDRLRVYCDTSVFGGCYDEGFALDSMRLMAHARAMRIRVLVSDLTFRELGRAPEQVWRVFSGLPPRNVEILPIEENARQLQRAYLKAGVLTARWKDDAMHVALATVARADAIVSWNFRHIVRLDRIKGFNAVNSAQGYGSITIISPREVDFDD